VIGGFFSLSMPAAIFAAISPFPPFPAMLSFLLAPGREAHLENETKNPPTISGKTTKENDRNFATKPCGRRRTETRGFRMELG
jgi:hypothetical protein